jgi:Skp family chaperone for outer membrane proteins
MKPSKLPNFAERQAAAADAKKALLAKFKPKPTVVDPNLDERRAARQAELEALRAKRAAERQAKREEAARKEAERRALEAEVAEAMELELRARQKAARDARYAARKQRRK